MKQVLLIISVLSCIGALLWYQVDFSDGEQAESQPLPLVTEAPPISAPKLLAYHLDYLSSGQSHALSLGQNQGVSLNTETRLVGQVLVSRLDKGLAVTFLVDRFEVSMNQKVSLRNLERPISVLLDDGVLQYDRSIDPVAVNIFEYGIKALALEKDQLSFSSSDDIGAYTIRFNGSDTTGFSGKRIYGALDEQGLRISLPKNQYSVAWNNDGMVEYEADEIQKIHSQAGQLLADNQTRLKISRLIDPELIAALSRNWVDVSKVSYQPAHRASKSRAARRLEMARNTLAGKSWSGIAREAEQVKYNDSGKWVPLQRQVVAYTILNPDHVPNLGEILVDPDSSEFLVNSALVALAESNLPSAQQELIRVARYRSGDEEDDRRRYKRAMISLGQVEEPSLDAIIEAERDYYHATDPKQRYLAGLVYGALLHKVKDSHEEFFAKRNSRLTSDFQSHDNQDKIHKLRILGNVGSAENIRLYRSTKNSNSDVVREAGVQLIRKVYDLNLVPELMAQYDSEKSTMTRIAIVEVLSKYAGEADLDSFVDDRLRRGASQSLKRALIHLVLILPSRERAGHHKYLLELAQEINDQELLRLSQEILGSEVSY